MNYLTDKVFHTYFSGVPNGSIIFREKKAVMCAIDRRTRVQLKEAPILPREEGRAIAETMIDYERLFRELDAYVGCAWDQDELTLKNGAVYSRHITYTGTVEGKTVTAQLWCQRKSHGCMDILTVDQKIIGFINPGRICSEITVLAGYESVTPLTRFDDPQIASAAILEMYQQVGGAEIEDEQMTRGVIIRHLVLPGCIDNSLGVLDWIADNFPKKDVLVSLMSQYVPMGRAKKLPPFDRRITQEEYDAVLSYLYLLELDNGYTQDFSAASAEYIPEFDLEGL